MEHAPSRLASFRWRSNVDAMPAPSLKRIDIVINTHLEAAWRQAQAEHLDQHSAVRVESGKLDVILDCDPSRSGRYAVWLARWRRQMWRVSGLRSMPMIEELELLTTALRHFDLVRARLPAPAGDVLRYRSADALLTARCSMPPQDEKRGRQVERDTAHAGSDLLFKDGPWRLIWLKTRQAAEFWGRGTRWCTAAQRNNAFNAYAGAGELWVLTTPSGRYQLATGSGEFRDAADNPATLEAVLAPAPLGLRRLMLPSAP